METRGYSRNVSAKFWRAVVRKISKRRVKEAVEVHSVPEEYRYIARQRCKCGGRYEAELQMLCEHEGRHYDIIQVRCLRCGAEKEFMFDIEDYFRALEESLRRRGKSSTGGGGDDLA